MSVLKKIFWTMIVAVAISIGYTSCFRKYAMNESQIQMHYASKNCKPVFLSDSFENHKLFYASIGPDTLPLLLFIHGAPGAWYGYLPMLDDTILQQKFKMIAVDRPGYGKSYNGSAVTSLDKQALVISRVIDKHPCHLPVYIMGRSYGAPIAAKLALMHQDRVAGLYLLSGAIDPEKEKFWWFSPIGNWLIIRWLLPRALNVATDEKYSHVQELKKLSNAWKHIHVPTTVMYGTNDWIVDTANYSYARKMLAHTKARFFLLQGAGHLISNENPSLVRAEILRDLKP